MSGGQGRGFFFGIAIHRIASAGVGTLVFITGRSVLWRTG